MAKFTIVNSSLQISVGATNVLYLPTLYIGVQSISLYETTPRVVLFNTAQGSNLTVFEGLLSDCTDSAGTPFTLSTFLTFASTYFGTSSNGSSPTNVTINGTVDVVDVETSKPYKYIAINSLNENVISSNNDTKLFTVSAIGLTSTVSYLKFYDSDITPEVGVDIPVLTIPVPANTQGAGIVITFNVPILFTIGLSFGITALPADEDVTPIDADSVIINLTYV